jgi:hypothetical protein
MLIKKKSKEDKSKRYNRNDVSAIQNKKPFSNISEFKKMIIDKLNKTHSTYKYRVTNKYIRLECNHSIDFKCKFLAWYHYEESRKGIHNITFARFNQRFHNGPKH